MHLRRRLQRAWSRRTAQWRNKLADVENTPGLGLLCLLGAATGGLAGTAILVLYGLTEIIQLPLLALFGGHQATFTVSDIAFRLVVPITGAIVLALIVEWRRQALENGIVHVIERLTYYQGQLPFRFALVDLIASAISIASGQSVGREGVAVHAGAFTGSWFGRRLSLPNNSVRTLVGCGAAAGIAASFNTPLTGVVFAMEVVMMEYTISGFAPIILAAVSGSLVTFDLPNVHPGITGTFTHFHVADLPIMTTMGLALGLIGGGFIRLIGQVLPRISGVRNSFRIVLAGGITGLLAIAYPQIMGLGFTTVNHALGGDYGAAQSLGIGISKLAATFFAILAALPGGVILPMIIAGAGLGSAFGASSAGLLSLSLSGSGLYALLGIGAMMAAVLQAPLTALVVVLELSGQTSMVLPGMLVTIAALVVSRRIADSDSIFRLLLRHRGLDYRNDPVSQYLRRASVLSAMNRRFRVLDAQTSRGAIMEVLDAGIDWLLIRPAEGRYQLIRPDDLRRTLANENQDDDPGYTVDLMDIPAYRADTYPIDVRASLQEAYDKFEATEAEALVVQRTASLTGRRPTPYGILTPATVAGTYRR